MTHDEAQKLAVQAAIAAYDGECSGYPSDEGSLKAAIAAFERAMWRPIDEAPKDGTAVLVYAPATDPAKWAVDLPSMICAARYHEDAGWCICTVREATLWRPLPAGPEGAP